MIALYTRESTREQAMDGYNLEMQKKKGYEYIQFKELQGEVKLYEEFGVSAKTTKRKKLNELKQDIKNGLIDIVIIYKLDRLVRRLKGLSEMVELFNQYDVQLISLSEEINTKTATGRMLMNMIVMLAEWEQDTISERMIDGLVEGARQGNYMKSRVSFGWEKCFVGDKRLLKWNEDEVRLIHDMVKYLKEDYNLYQISLIINEDEYMKSSNKRIDEESVKNILLNKINLGIMELQGKEYKLNIKPIFTKKEYEEIKILIRQKELRRKFDYLFDKRIYNKNDEVAVNTCTIKKEKVYLYYVDNKSNTRINEVKIIDQLIDYISESEWIDKKRRGKSYKATVNFYERKLNNLSELVANGQVSAEEFKKQKKRISKILNKAKEDHIIYVTCFKDYFNGLEYKEKKSMIDRYITKIYIDFDKKKIIRIE